MTEASLLRAAELGGSRRKPLGAETAAGPKPRYDAVIVGDDAVALVAALSLLAEHGRTKVAVLAHPHGPTAPTGPLPLVPPIRTPEALEPVWRAAFDLWPRLATALGLCFASRPAQVLDLIDSPEDAFRAARRGNALAGSDRPAVRMQPRGIADMIPGWSSPGGGNAGLCHQMGMVLCADAVRAALIAAIRAAGGDILPDLRVDGLRIAQGQIVGLDTPTMRISTDHVVLACPDRSPALAAQIGVDQKQVAVIRATLSSEPVPGLCRPVLNWADGVVFCQDRDGRLSVDFDLDHPDKCPLIDQIAAPAARLLDHLPDAAATPMRAVTRRHSTRRPGGLPLLAQPNLPGLSLSGGWQGHELAIAPWAGRALADLVVRGSAGPLARGLGLTPDEMSQTTKVPA